MTMRVNICFFISTFYLACLPLLGTSVLVEEQSLPCLDYAYNYPTRYQQGCCLWEGHLDLLYLEARNSFAPVEQGTKTNQNLDFFLPFDFRPEEFSYNWKGGFRIGGGLNLPNDRFAIDLSWFHYRTSASLRGNLPDGSVNYIIPFTNVISSDAGTVNFFSSNYSSYLTIHVNQLDLSIHREYILTPGVILSPKVGVTFLDIKSKLNLNIYPQRFIARGQNKNYYDVDVSNRFYGLGIVGGLDSIWNVGCGFGLYSQLQTALIWGRYETSAPITTTSNNYHTRFAHENLVPTFNFAFGFLFQNEFDDASQIRLKAGWEGFYYYDQTTINLQPSLVSRPLTLQGFVFSLAYSM